MLISDPANIVLIFLLGMAYTDLPCTPLLWPTPNILLSTINIGINLTIRLIFFHCEEKQDYVILSIYYSTVVQ